MTDQSLYCANHPKRETSLRCNRCEKPICSSCAVLTPVGYRCKECIRGQQAGFDTALLRDYPLASIIAAVGVGLGIGILGYLWYWAGFIFAPVVGGGLAEVIRVAVGRRRSRRLPFVAVIGGVIGVLPHLFPVGLGIFSVAYAGASPAWLGSVGLKILFLLAYGFLMISTLFYRLRGIRW
ncbi:MAG: hypothetical protein A2Z14_02120 [Chloroflexi bacterium RBG_16_48_8]|nr:MAG: hypothetical protein A2Z14_02120 [Chloroflexi bacterium RBG_16_48_8]